MLIAFKACADPSSTTRTPVRLKPGVLTKVIVLIPYGHKALAKLRLLRGETQVIPDEGWIMGNGETLEWSEMIDIETEEVWQAEVVNDDTRWPHCFYIRLEIQHRSVARPLEHLYSLFKKIVEGLGLE